jgi:hypothetical protein
MSLVNLNTSYESMTMSFFLQISLWQRISLLPRLDPSRIVFVQWVLIRRQAPSSNNGRISNTNSPVSSSSSVLAMAVVPHLHTEQLYYGIGRSVYELSTIILDIRYLKTGSSVMFVVGWENLSRLVQWCLWRQKHLQGLSFQNEMLSGEDLGRC